VWTVSEHALHVVVEADAPEEQIDLHLLGSQQIEGLERIERAAMVRVLAQPAVDRLPLGLPRALRLSLRAAGRDTTRRLELVRILLHHSPLLALRTPAPGTHF
jgi:hypothetical protein